MTFKIATALLSWIFLASCATAPDVSPAIRADLAPTGTLRAGINYGNGVLATRDPVTGEARGIAVNLARELGRRAGVPIELIERKC